jgi:hypothetical protein
MWWHLQVDGAAMVLFNAQSSSSCPSWLPRMHTPPFVRAFGRSILSCLTLRSFVHLIVKHLIVKHLIVKHHIVKSDTMVLKLWDFIDEGQVCTM